MSENEKSLTQGIAEIVLNGAIDKYYENPSWDAFCRVLNQLVHAWVFNLTAICPFEMEEGRGQYKNAMKTLENRQREKE